MRSDDYSSNLAESLIVRFLIAESPRIAVGIYTGAVVMIEPRN
jgi:hypothetical protein